jgi:hypothetical protein
MESFMKVERARTETVQDPVKTIILNEKFLSNFSAFDLKPCLLESSKIILSVKDNKRRKHIQQCLCSTLAILPEMDNVAEG